MFTATQAVRESRLKIRLASFDQNQSMEGIYWCQKRIQGDYVGEGLDLPCTVQKKYQKEQEQESGMRFVYWTVYRLE